MRLRSVLAFLLLAIPTGAYAQSGTGPESVLKRLYAAHQPWAQKDVLSDGSLADYFDERIVRLIRDDRECRAPGWGVGNLDFDPILDAQDYGDKGIGDLRFRRIDGGKGTRYEVSFFLFPGVSKARRHLVYSLAKSSGHWRITDIQYEQGTLLRVLAPRASDLFVGDAHNPRQTTMRAMESDDAQAWQARWREVELAEVAELRSLPAELKLRQIEALLQSAWLFDWSSDASEDEQVRELWTNLRRRLGIR